MTQITTEGESSRHYAAERATLTITYRAEEDALSFGESAARDKHRRALEVAHSLRDNGDATWLHADPVSTYTQRRLKSIHKEAEQETPEYENVTFGFIRVLVKLSNLSIVSRVVSDLQGEGFGVSVSWNLTEDSRNQYQRDVRIRAVQKSQDRAREYAEALGKTVAKVVSISDIGVGAVSDFRARSAAVGSANVPEITIPEITVSARVTGVFETE